MESDKTVANGGVINVFKGCDGDTIIDIFESISW